MSTLDLGITEEFGAFIAVFNSIGLVVLVVHKKILISCCGNSMISIGVWSNKG